MSEAQEPKEPPTAEQGAPGAEATPAVAPPGGEQPRAAELFVAAAMVTLVAGLVLWGAVAQEQEPVLDVGTVSPAQALDPQAVPSGAFATVVGKPDPSRVAPLYSMRPGREQDLLLVFRDAPRLVLYCRAKHPLAQAVYRHPPTVRGQPVTAGEFEETWELSGRICDADKYSDPNLGSAGVSIQQLAVERLGVAAGEVVRVLAIGATPGDLRRSAQTAVVFGAGMTLVAIALWTLAIHGVVRSRDARREADAAA
ncbi:MAG TPA: hypothetical protein VNE39_02860 [Planctomycetota bacterium]|nr:hypothetical protein [Planctomycetota bacterium]